MTNLHNLGILYRKEENYEQSESYLQRAFDLRTEKLGEGHADTLDSQHELGKVRATKHTASS